MSAEPFPTRRDPAALAAYIESRRPDLLRFIDSRLGSVLRGKVEPQDVLQELAVKSLHDLPAADFSVLDPFQWLCHLAEQCVIDGHRRFAADKRDARREVSGNVRIGEASQELNALLIASMTSPTQAVVRNERQRKIDEALAAMPREHREILRMRYQEGLSTKAIAQRLGKSHGALRVLLTRLVRRLEVLVDANAQSEP
jgi:RNA polymerase sigma-70 factor, ECF subfamily